MRKFKFKLQKLLEIREAREKEIQNELASAIALQNIEKEIQQRYRESIAEQHAKFDEKIKAGKFSYSVVLMFERYVEFANMVIRNQQTKIEGMEPEIEKIRVRLVEASKERKVVERLRERKWKEYLYDLNREIGKENDDMNQKMYLRKHLKEAV